MDQGLVTKAEELLASFQKTAYVLDQVCWTELGQLLRIWGECPGVGIPLIPGAFYSGWFKA